MGLYDRGSVSNGSFLSMYDRYKGCPDVRYGTSGVWRIMYLVELDKLLPLVLPNTASRLEPPNFNSISGKDTCCHSVRRMGRGVRRWRVAWDEMSSNVQFGKLNLNRSTRG